MFKGIVDSFVNFEEIRKIVLCTSVRGIIAIM